MKTKLILPLSILLFMSLNLSAEEKSEMEWQSHKKEILSKLDAEKNCDAYLYRLTSIVNLGEQQVIAIENIYMVYANEIEAIYTNKGTIQLDHQNLDKSNKKRIVQTSNILSAAQNKLLDDYNNDRREKLKEKMSIKHNSLDNNL